MYIIQVAESTDSVSERLSTALSGRGARTGGGIPRARPSERMPRGMCVRDTVGDDAAKLRRRHEDDTGR